MTEEITTHGSCISFEIYTDTDVPTLRRNLGIDNLDVESLLDLKQSAKVLRIFNFAV